MGLWASHVVCLPPFLPLYRSEMPSMVNEIREREEKAKALEEEYGRMNKTIHRGLYTRRILDIINSINKQKKGIDTVIQVGHSGMLR